MNDRPELCQKPGTTIAPDSQGSFIPVWGEVLVMDSRVAARQLVASTPKIEQKYVRLVQMASTPEIRRMLLPGKEVCGQRTGLYIRVARTCPLYYARWEADESVACLELLSTMKATSTRPDWLEALGCTGDTSCKRTPVGAKVWRRRTARNRSGGESQPSYADDADTHDPVFTLPREFLVRDSLGFVLYRGEESDDSGSSAARAGEVASDASDSSNAEEEEEEEEEEGEDEEEEYEE